MSEPAETTAPSNSVNAGCCNSVARRTILTAAVAGGATATLAACAAPQDPIPSATDAGSSPSASETKDASSQGLVLGLASSVAVGSGQKFPAGRRTVLVSQPAEGEFVAFDAKCTHQGCEVSGIEGGEIRCACHGARFDATTGEVLKGPAELGLEQLSVKVVNDELILES